MMNRTEHVEWCKQPAREYLDRNEVANAAASMTSDVNMRPDCAVANHLAMLETMAAMNNDLSGSAPLYRRFSVSPL